MTYFLPFVRPSSKFGSDQPFRTENTVRNVYCYEKIRFTKIQSYDIATVCHNFSLLSVSRTHFVRSTVEMEAFSLVNGAF